RLKQEIVLGIGGERLLRAIGFRILTYHLNEGHAALLAFSLLKHQPALSAPDKARALTYAVDQVRAKCIFTTHTPVEAGHDRFSYDEVNGTLGDFADLQLLQEL